MEIYSFIDLSNEQRKELYNFIINLGSNSYFDTYDEMVKGYTGPVFNKGTTHYSLWDGGLLKGTIGIITKDVLEKGEVFITAINISAQNKEYFEILLKKSIGDSMKVHPKKLKLGIHSSQDYLIPFAKILNFKEIYKAITLSLSSTKALQAITEGPHITFKNVSKENKLDFKDVHNRGFLHSPNGSILTDQQIDEVFLKNKENPNLTGICYFKAQAVGVYELNIKEQVGWIEGLAIAPEWQGKGIGKILLKRAVTLLHDSGVKEVKLSVISSNERACRLYLKYGFIEEKIASFWFEKPIE